MTRALEHDVAALTAGNPYKGGATEAVVNFLADPVEMKLLHMLTADAARTPTFTAFANRPISVPEALELIAQGKALLAAAHLLAVNA